MGWPIYNTSHVCGVSSSNNSLTKLYNVLVIYALLVAMCTCLIISVLVYPQSKIALSKGTFLKFLPNCLSFFFFHKHTHTHTQSISPPKSPINLCFLTF